MADSTMDGIESPQAAEASHFDVLILGPFTLFRDGLPIDTSGWQRKVQALFRILATSPRHRRSRDHLVEMLWPETSSEAGYRNLRVVLHMLRRSLGCEPSAVLSEGGYIQLNPFHHWDIDLERLEEGLELLSPTVETLESAAGYYRGEPLPDDRYEEWAVAVRVRVQRTWRDLCLRLANVHRDLGAPQTSVLWLDRAMESDPLDEDALRQILVTLGGMDRRTEALRRYQHFAQRLKQELDLAPGGETLAVVADLRATPQMAATSAIPSPSSEPVRPIPVIPRSIPMIDGRLHGRQDELGRILWSLPPVRVAGPRAVFLEGGPGLGKTRLLAEVASRARHAGMMTLGGAAYKHEGGLKYGAVRDALADYVEAQPDAVLAEEVGTFGSDLVGVLPELRLRFPEMKSSLLQPGEDEHLRLFFAVTRVLDAISRATPLVLLLDDLQWADKGTRRLLHFVARQSVQNRMLLVGAYRPAENSENHSHMADLASAMFDSGSSVTVGLGPLHATAIQDLVEEHLRGRVAESVKEALKVAGGNPLAALQRLDEWRQAGRVERVEGTYRLSSPDTTSIAAPS